MSFFQRQRNFWNEVIWKPKKLHSLEQLKYHHQVLEHNPSMTDSNKKLIVETFRAIAEILIWGDQNDSSVFDFFLEKNMQSYFLRTLNQNCGRYVVLQLLQTLSILFDNIRNETSIYYLLSNNHVNSIIVLKLDFSDEEVLAYYISFLKTLSFKLNKHTIHFFYNEHLRDFPLYTEAIKFFNHPESMVRIAVRTLTLNVYKVNDKNMLEYIRNKTAAPYFSNLVWFIGNHIIQLDQCLAQASLLHRSQLESLVAEHLDHIHYINDIFSLDISSLSDILIDQLLNRLFVPLYVYSLFEVPQSFLRESDSPHIDSKVALFLLTQVFLILKDKSLINQLGFLILTGDSSLNSYFSLNSPSSMSIGRHRRNSSGSIRAAFPPQDESLSFTLNRSKPINADVTTHSDDTSSESMSDKDKLNPIPECDGFVVIESPSDRQRLILQAKIKQIENDIEQAEKTIQSEDSEVSLTETTPIHNLPIISSVFIDSILSAIIPSPNDDSRCLFAISLIYSIMYNEGINPHLLEAFSLQKIKGDQKRFYLHDELVGRLLSVVEASAVGSVRLVTLYSCLALLNSLLEMPLPQLSEHHRKKLTRAHEGSCMHLAEFYKTMGSGDDMFLEMFEDEYAHSQRYMLQVERLLMDDTLLLPPTESPMTGIDFTRRFPCGDTERARKAMRTFFAIREFWLKVYNKTEEHFPLTPSINTVTTEDTVDTNKCDLVACKVINGENSVERFMLVTDNEFMLVNPDKTVLGCGIVKFIAFLQDVDITPDPADSCGLFIVAHHRSRSQVKRRPALSAKFLFEDHIRCLATRQSLLRRKELLRHNKMVLIASLIGIPPLASPVRRRLSPVSPLEWEDQASEQASSNTIDQLPVKPIDQLPVKPINRLPMSSANSPQYQHHVLATRVLNDSLNDPLSPQTDNHYELNNFEEEEDDSLLARNDNVKFINNTEQIILPIEGNKMDVRILAPLSMRDVRDQIKSVENEHAFDEIGEEEREKDKVMTPSNVIDGVVPSELNIISDTLKLVQIETMPVEIIQINDDEATSVQINQDEVQINQDEVQINQDEVQINQDEVQINQDEVQINQDEVQINQDEIALVQINQDEVQISQDETALVQIDQDEVQINQDEVQINQDEVQINQDEVQINQDEVQINQDEVQINQDEVQINQDEVQINQDEIALVQINQDEVQISQDETALVQIDQDEVQIDQDETALVQINNTPNIMSELCTTDVDHKTDFYEQNSPIETSIY